ncbi:MAG: hypothetical protein KAS72_10435 [Phycisphaerales bacterium]|nr:hypothetical protein [Phycisphaerales bacterium]
MDEPHEQAAFCIGCGYSRTGLPQGHVCPECGRDARAARPRLCAALAPFADDIARALLYSVVTVGPAILGFLIWFERPLKRASRDAALKRALRLALRRRRLGRLAQPVGLRIAVMAVLVFVAAMVLPSVYVEQARAVLFTAMAAALTLLCVHGTLVVGVWHALALDAARLPVSRAVLPAVVVALAWVGFFLVLTPIVFWPWERSAPLINWMLLMPVAAGVLGGGWWVYQWHQIAAALRCESRPGTVRAGPGA